MAEAHARDIKYDDLVDKVLLLEQEQTSIMKIQQKQLCTLARLSDLNSFLGAYGNLLTSLKDDQHLVLDKCDTIDDQIKTLINFVNEANDD